MNKVKENKVRLFVIYIFVQLNAGCLYLASRIVTVTVDERPREDTTR